MSNCLPRDQLLSIGHPATGCKTVSKYRCFLAPTLASNEIFLSLNRHIPYGTINQAGEYIRDPFAGGERCVGASAAFRLVSDLPSTGTDIHHLWYYQAKWDLGLWHGVRFDATGGTRGESGSRPCFTASLGLQ